MSSSSTPTTSWPGELRSVQTADSSRLPSSIPLGAGGLPDAARRLLPTSGDALRFNALWGNVERNVRLTLIEL